LSTKTQTCIVLNCDGCGRSAQHYEGWTPHYETADQGRDEQADSYEWLSDGILDFCENCKILSPHGFVQDPDIPTNDMCDRCGIPQDEHEGVTS